MSGGSLQTVSIRARLFAVAADADATYGLGGWNNENQANGDGSTRLIKTRVPWEVSGLSLVIDPARADLEFLQEIANGGDYVDMAVTFASGVTYQGRGQITGEVKASTMNATAPITLGGPGELSSQ